MLSDLCLHLQATGTTRVEAGAEATAKAAKATKALARAKLQLLLRGPPGPLTISQFASAIIAKLAVRRRISATSRTFASSVLLSTRPTSARPELGTPRARVQPNKRRREQRPQSCQLRKITPLRQPLLGPLYLLTLLRRPKLLLNQLQLVQASARRVLYLFAGKPRKWDMRECLTKLGYEQGIDIQIDCIDIQRKPQIDLSKTKEQGAFQDLGHREMASEDVPMDSSDAYRYVHFSYEGVP